MTPPAVDISGLSDSERFALIEQLWESLRARVGTLPLRADEGALVEERRAAHRDDPESAIAWETVRAELALDQAADEQRRADEPPATH